MASRRGERGRGAGLQRLALFGFSIALLLLFVGIAVAQGIGQPDVPSGDAAIVESVPEEIGTVSEADFKHALFQQAAQGGLKKTPKPGESKYEELKTAAMGELLDTIWIQGEAEELGISVTPKEIATELEQIKKQNFPTDGAYEKFLKESKFTQEDVDDRVKLQLLSTQIQEQITKEAPAASEDEIAGYYDAELETQFTTPESREARVLVNEDEEKVEVAKAQLEKDSSPKSWKEIAAKYSEDPNTKDKGGLQSGLTEELLQTQVELTDAVFGHDAGEIVGPTSVQGKFFVTEVEKIEPEKTQELDEVRAQIESQLTQQASQEFFATFVAGYQSKWESRTFCAEGFTVETCSNYAGDGHPASAPTACYEADPEGGIPTDCPSPVTQPSPALPGSITVVKPDGDRLPQRPRPPGEVPATPEGAVPSASAVP